jgi:hypothetical protein
VSPMWKIASSSRATVVDLPGDIPETGNDVIDSASLLILEGRDAILAHSQFLEEFAATTGQHAAMHGLQFVLDHEYAARKVPYLVCLISQPCGTEALSLENLLGCVLFLEYRFGSWKTGLITTGDSSGIRTVLGPAGDRSHIAAVAAAAMLKQARLVLVSFKQDGSSLSEVAFPDELSALWAVQVREVQDHLPLLNSYEATLATLGRRTRNHLRYYRRRLQEELSCEFVPDVRSCIQESELVALNSSSLDPLTAEIFEHQYRSTADLPGGFVCGVRTREGRWLSLAGGWRQQTTSLVQWQMNAAGYEKLSLGTAFRAFLLEYEIEHGSTKLCFHNGTSHSMHHSFPRELVVDFLLRRPSPLLSFLVKHLPAISRKTPALAGRGNFIADVLRNPDLNWRSLSASPSWSVSPEHRRLNRNQEQDRESNC